MSYKVVTLAPLSHTFAVIALAVVSQCNDILRTYTLEELGRLLTNIPHDFTGVSVQNFPDETIWITYCGLGQYSIVVSATHTACLESMLRFLNFKFETETVGAENTKGPANAECSRTDCVPA